MIATTRSMAIGAEHMPASASVSPALRVGGAGGAGGGSGRAAVAHEIKFLLTEEEAREVEGRLLASLLPDPHSDPALGGMYAITSLACDDADFGAFHRDERMRSRGARAEGTA